MKENLPDDLRFKTTMEKLEAAKRGFSNGQEYWFAREIQPILGYSDWGNFEATMTRAANAMRNNDIEPSHHIADTTNMMALGKNAHRQVKDMFLTRAACYLTAINGDSTKPEIAAAQAYFASQTRAKEVADQESTDRERLEKRGKVTQSFKTVSGVAQKAGLPGSKQPIFHDARYLGLYGKSRKSVMNEKGLTPKENPFDRMGALELSANDFQMNLAAETIQKDRIRGASAVIKKNREVAERVRKTMLDSGATAPERLPAAEPIKEVKKRVKKSTKKIATD